MLKSTGFAKARSPRIHTGVFNPLTLGMGAAKELSDKPQYQAVEAPDYEGTGAVYQNTPLPESK
ncbi:MAG TPA: hypothetical protein VNU93_10365 [Verrucomicrobiae bacterium]|nr:hypothetical protein [Verrucomicrobiae bacterium]